MFTLNSSEPRRGYNYQCSKSLTQQLQFFAKLTEHYLHSAKLVKCIGIDRKEHNFFFFLEVIVQKL